MRKYNIPIFVPHRGCPFDCVFCNQKRITGQTEEVTPQDVTATVERYLKTIPEAADIETAFFGGSFTGIPIEEQSALMECVQPYIKSGRIKGIRLSTRPDYINREILDNLRAYGVTTIELGVQSMSGAVLKAANRGHSPEQVTAAVSLIKEYGFDFGLQMMTGLPGDSGEESVYTAKKIIELKPDCVRIYPTLTIKDTFLEKLYLSGRYKPQSLDEAVELSKKLLLMFEAAGINVIRLGLQPTEEINENASVTAGPFHSAFRELVENSVYYDIIAEKIKDISGDAVIYVNSKNHSKACGNRKCNIRRIKDRFGINITIKDDELLTGREVRCIAVKKT